MQFNVNVIKSGAKNPTLPMVSVGEIPYASQAFYTASWQTKHCYSNEYRNMSGYWHMFTFLLEHNIGLKNMDFTWKRIYNYMFGVFSCMVQGKDWYGTHTFTAQCTQNNMEHPFCIKEVVQQREQLLIFHSQQHCQLHIHDIDILNFPINSHIWKKKNVAGEITKKLLKIQS